MLLTHVTQNFVIQLPRPSGRGIIETVLLALATFGAFYGAKARILDVIIPRPEGRGNSSVFLRTSVINSHHKNYLTDNFSESGNEI
jgi:hypothetical protein